MIRILIYELTQMKLTLSYRQEFPIRTILILEMLPPPSSFGNGLLTLETLKAKTCNRKEERECSAKWTHENSWNCLKFIA